MRREGEILHPFFIFISRDNSTSNVSLLLYSFFYLFCIAYVFFDYFYYEYRSARVVRDGSGNGTASLFFASSFLLIELLFYLRFESAVASSVYTVLIMCFLMTDWIDWQAGWVRFCVLTTLDTSFDTFL